MSRLVMLLLFGSTPTPLLLLLPLLPGVVDESGDGVGMSLHRVDVGMDEKDSEENACE